MPARSRSPPRCARAEAPRAPPRDPCADSAHDPTRPSPVTPLGGPPMTPGTPARTPVERRWAIVGVLLGVVVLALLIGLVALVWLGRTGGLPAAAASPTASTAPEAGSYLYPSPQPAPPLGLVDEDGRPFDLATLRGVPVLLFFGYTHCPDVCPTTIGVLNRVLGDLGTGPRAVFVSIDPERDTPAALKEYLAVPPRRLHGPDRQPDPGADGSRRVRRDLRPDRHRVGERVRDGPHRERLPPRRRRGAAGDASRSAPRRRRSPRPCAMS